MSVTITRTKGAARCEDGHVWSAHQTQITRTASYDRRTKTGTITSVDPGCWCGAAVANFTPRKRG